METAEVTRMKELVQKLNEAAKAYYQEDREIMSNREYDALYDELEQTEKITGIVLISSSISSTLRPASYQFVPGLTMRNRFSSPRSLIYNSSPVVIRCLHASSLPLL